MDHYYIYYYGPPRTYQWNGDTTQTNIECIWMMSVTYNRDSTTRLFYLHELSFKLINNYKNIPCQTEHHQYIRHHIICSKPENLLQLCQLLLSYFNKNPEATSSFKELLLSLRLPVLMNCKVPEKLNDLIREHSDPELLQIIQDCKDITVSHHFCIWHNPTNIKCIWMMSVTYNRDSPTRLFLFAWTLIQVN